MGYKSRLKQSQRLGFSKKQIPSLHIKVSPRSGNFLIVCGNCSYCIDSASKIKDAKLVLSTVLKILKQYPIEKFTSESWNQWMAIHHAKIPTVDAVILYRDGVSDSGFKPTMFSDAMSISVES